MKWTNEERLKLIGRIAAPMIIRPLFSPNEILARAEKIYFLASQPGEFLEANRDEFIEEDE